MRLKHIVMGLALVALPACGVWDSVKGLVSLSAAIAKEFGGQNAINIGDQGRLTVTFQNSDAANLPADEREKFARRVAEFVVTHYANVDSVSTIAVGFKSQRGALGVTISSSETPYAWSVRELRAPIDSTRSKPDSAKKP